jgi:serine/threonine protein kinase
MRTLHHLGVIHGNLKPPNLLLDWKCRVKICDIGQIRAFLPSLNVDNCWHIGKSNHNFVYLSPEAVIETNVRSGTEKMDVYGFGILVWELCYLSAGKWYSSVDREAYIRSMSLSGSRPPIPSRWPTRIQALINNCIQQGQFHLYPHISAGKHSRRLHQSCLFLSKSVGNTSRSTKAPQLRRYYFPVAG